MRHSETWIRAAHKKLLSLVDAPVIAHGDHWVQAFYPTTGDELSFRCCCGERLRITDDVFATQSDFTRHDIEELTKLVGFDKNEVCSHLMVQCSVLWEILREEVVLHRRDADDLVTEYMAKLERQVNDRVSWALEAL
jgi:hypothetical protein